MKTAVIALTRNGAELAFKVGSAIDGDVYAKDDYINKFIFNSGFVLAHPFTSDFGKLVKKLFHNYEGLVFIMACEIVVRGIAPYIKSKEEDPAVVVVDEMGRFAVSLLSGHMGGANNLAGTVAAITGGVPVITTSTDTNNIIAFDVFAKKNNCVIENIGELKHISSELVSGGIVSFYTDCRLSGILPPNIICYEPGQNCKVAVVLSNKEKVWVIANKVLYLRPRNLIIGIGCKKGKSKEEIERAVIHFLRRNGRSILSLRCLASLEIKAEEKGILDFCREKEIEYVTVSTEEIRSVESKFSTSEFVRKVTGVGNVAEACAVISGENSRLVCPKTVYNGITLTLAEEDRNFLI